MCFGKTWSAVSLTTMLIACAITISKKASWRITAFVIFLASKELFQLLLYYNLPTSTTSACPPVNRLLTVLSWIHVSLQPFFVLLFISAFSKKRRLYDVPLLLAVIYAAFNATRLKELYPGPVQTPCSNLDPETSMCRAQTCSIKGAHHVAYGFSLASADADHTLRLIPTHFAYVLLSIFTPIIIGDWQIALIHSAVAYIALFIAPKDLGEAAAIWCLNSFWMGILAIYFVYRGSPFA